MVVRITFRTTTMFYSVVGAAFLSTSALAADMDAKAPLAATPTILPAVDGYNGKVEGFGGSFASRSFYGTQGAFSFPLPGQYGVQIDASKGSLDNRQFAGVGGHLFWRDPNRGLLGIYGSYLNWNVQNGVQVGVMAGEGAWYNGRWTVEGIAGVEFGNSTSTIFGNPITGLTIQSVDIQTRFFDKINVAYYITDNIKGYIGHRYVGGLNAVALGSEYGFAVNNNILGALFVEARAGEDHYQGIWGGARFYFGQRDKTLMARHRQDDPIIWLADSLITIIANTSITNVPGIGLGDGDGDGDGDCDGDGDGECGC